MHRIIARIAELERKVAELEKLVQELIQDKLNARRRQTLSRETGKTGLSTRVVPKKP